MTRFSKNSKSAKAFFAAVTLAFFAPLCLFSATGTVSSGTTSSGKTSSVGASAGAGGVHYPSLSPLFTTEKKSPEIDALDIIRYGLLFSECKEGSASWNDSILKFKEAEAIVRAPDFLSLPVKERAEKILTVMYDNILVQYVEDQSKMDVLFSKGTYNCVSSSVLYAALARAAKVPFIGVKTPTHAFCSVFTSGGSASGAGEERIDVETTNPLGFDPGRKQVLETSEKTTKYAVIQKKNYVSRHDVSIKTLISLVGNNLTSSYIKKNDYDRAVPMALTVFLFRKGESDFEVDDARSSFDTAFLNHSVVLSRKKEYIASVDWLNMVTEKYGFTDKVRSDYNGAVYNGVVYLVSISDFSGAEAFYQKNKKNLTPEKDFSIRKMIFISETQEKLKEFEGKKQFDEALEFVRGKYSDPLSKEKSVTEALDNWQEYYWISKINDLMGKTKYMEALSASEKAISALPSSARLKKTKSNVLYNHDVYYHNMVSSYVSSKDYKNALKIIEAGLEENPQSQLLKKDRDLINQALSR